MVTVPTTLIRGAEPIITSDGLAPAAATIFVFQTAAQRAVFAKLFPLLTSVVTHAATFCVPAETVRAGRCIHPAEAAVCICIAGLKLSIGTGCCFC